MHSIEICAFLSFSRNTNTESTQSEHGLVERKEWTHVFFGPLYPIERAYSFFFWILGRRKHKWMEFTQYQQQQQQFLCAA